MLLVPLFLVIYNSLFSAESFQVVEQREQYHTTANQWTSWDLIDYQDGYIYFIKNKEIIKIGIDGRNAKALKTYKFPFIGHQPYHLRVIGDYVFVDSPTWWSDRKVRIDGKSVEYLKGGEQFWLGGTISNGWRYLAAVDYAGVSLTKINIVMTENVEKEVLFEFEQTETNPNKDGWLSLDAYEVLCKEWIFVTLIKDETEYEVIKMKTDGSDLQKVDQLSGCGILFSEEDDIYFSGFSEDGFHNDSDEGLWRMNIYNNEITEIESLRSKIVCSYVDGAAVYAEETSDKYFFSIGEKAFELPDFFEDCGFIIVDETLYFATATETEHQANGLYLFSMDRDGNLTKMY